MLITDWKGEAKRRYYSVYLDPPSLSVASVFEIIDILKTPLYHAMMRIYKRRPSSKPVEWWITSIARISLTQWLLDRPDILTWDPRHGQVYSREIMVVTSIITDMSPTVLVQALDAAILQYGIPPKHAEKAAQELSYIGLLLPEAHPVIAP
jgi:hypothetical protein